MERKRYHCLDNIRGITLISMIAYHAVWDIVYLFDVDWEWFGSDLTYLWQQSICWTFILLSGFCWSMGRRKFRRASVVFLAGAIVSGVTIVMMPESIIIFGILTFLGTAMFLMCGLDCLLKKINPVIGLIASGLTFFLTRNINDGNLGFEGLEIIQLPEKWYTNLFTTFLGFVDKGFFSTDYFSLFPWFFLFASGYFVYRIVEKKNYLIHIEGKKIPGLSLMGRHSLILYLVHQPAIYLILCLIFTNVR